MDRRDYLRALGSGVSIGATVLAGCGAPNGEGPADTPTEGPETETATATETATETGAAAGNDTTTGTAAGEVTNTIEMVTEGSEYYFDPIGLLVEPGETVVWRNESGSHSSTAYVPDNPQAEVRRIPEAAEGWDSGILTEQGATFEHTVDVPGTYDYFCIPHKTLGMVGRLVVGEPGDVEGDPPDGSVPSAERIVEEDVVTYEEFQGG